MLGLYPYVCIKAVHFMDPKCRLFFQRHPLSPDYGSGCLCAGTAWAFADSEPALKA